MPDGEATVAVRMGAGGEASEEELDAMGRGLLRDLRDAGIDGGMAPAAGGAVAGAKAGVFLEIGKLLLTFAPAALPKLVEVVNGWMGRGKDRSIEIELPNGAKFKSTGVVSVSDVEKLVAALGGAGGSAKA